MGKIKVIIVNDQKEIKIPSGIRMLIRRCCTATLQETNLLNVGTEVSVKLVDNLQIKTLNREYRRINKETDVLSFPQYHPEELAQQQPSETISLGDIVISVPQAFQQASYYGHTIQREIGFLTVHAMLHLLGYDHEQGGLAAVQMREKEETVLKKLGIPWGASYVLEDD